MLLAWLAYSPVHADNRVSLECSHRQMTMDDILRCEITVTIEDDSRVGEVQLPEFRGFQVLNRQTSSSEQISVVNFKMARTSVNTTVVSLQPTRTGRITIPSVWFMDGNRRVISKPFNVTVAKTIQPQALEEGGTNALEAPLSPSEQQTSQLFIRLIPEKNEVYLGEQFNVSLYVYLQVDVDHAIPEYPKFQGFESHPIEVPKIEMRRKLFINGRRYDVQVLDRRVLIPRKTGELTIEPYRFRFQAGDGFFRQRQETVRRSPPVKITVKPLPEEGKPADFLRGAVGSFKLQSQVDRRSTEVNQPVEYRLKMTGTADMDAISLPQPAVPDGVKTYPPSQSGDTQQQGSGIVGQKTLELLFVPERAGAFTIPAVSFSYFDPETGTYRQAKAPSYRIQVRPASAGAQKAGGWQAPEKQILEMDADALRPLHFSGEMSSRKASFARSWIFQALVFLPLVLTLLMGLVDLLRRLLPLLRGSEAARKAKEIADLTRKAEALAKKNDVEFYPLVVRLLDMWAEQFAGETLKGLTRSAAEGRMVEKGMNEEAANRWRKLGSTCDSARFAGSGDGGRMLDLWNEALSWRKEVKR